MVRTQPEPGMEGRGEAAVRAGPSPGMPGVDAMLDATRGEGICLARAEPCGKLFRCGSSAHGWGDSGMGLGSHGWQGARHQSAEVRRPMPAGQPFCPLQHCRCLGACGTLAAQPVQGAAEHGCLRPDGHARKAGRQLAAEVACRLWLRAAAANGVKCMPGGAKWHTLLGRARPQQMLSLSIL